MSSELEKIQRVDFVFISGALHCCEFPFEVLAELVGLGATYIFITRTAFAESNEILFNVQKSYLSSNGPGALPEGSSDKEVFYPNVFIPKSRVEELLMKHYQIRFKVIEERGVYKVGRADIKLYGYFCELKR